MTYEQLIERIRNANYNWKRARERGDAEAMRQNNAIVTEATNELVDMGYSIEAIWEAVEG